MRTIYQATMDGSDSILYQPISMFIYYLQCAKEYKYQLEHDEKLELWLKPTIALIMFSTMALEAFISELAEFHIEDEHRDSFDRCQKIYLKPKTLKQSSVRFKFNILFETKFQKPIPDEIGAQVEYLIELRNTLVHYKTGKTAGQYQMHPPIRTPTSGGADMVTLDFTKPPKIYIPPFIQQVTVEAGVKAYTIVYECLKLWFEADGKNDDVKKLEEYRP
jgi:hypothetical protein